MCSILGFNWKDEWFADHSSFPTFKISEKASKKVVHKLL
tara:strand:+ start:297 stop:413 length:117 start_codon:yes stop_codon:yes gene_type:complete